MKTEAADDQRMFAAKYRWAVDELRKFDGICPRDCNLCEEKETLVLIPGEARRIAQAARDSLDERARLTQSLHESDQSSESCRMQCSACNSCRIYPERPVDCRSFPVVPEFSLVDNTIRVRVSRSYCPIAETLPPGFVETVQRVWQELSEFLPSDWKRRYNDTPSLP